jgi:hypothetical protein
MPAAADPRRAFDGFQVIRDQDLDCAGTARKINRNRRQAARRGCGVNAALRHPRPGSRLPVDFDHINRVALRSLPALLGRWLPGGRREGREYCALNPTRHDRHLGSFRVNLHTGQWADFATGDRGGDVISLAAYLSHLSQIEAAEKLADMLGISMEARYGR